MEAKCANHWYKAAVTDCRQCHKHLCETCVIDVPGVPFCSMQCSDVFHQTEGRSAPAPAAGERSTQDILDGVFGADEGGAFGQAVPQEAASPEEAPPEAAAESAPALPTAEDVLARLDAAEAPAEPVQSAGVVEGQPVIRAEPPITRSDLGSLVETALDLDVPAQEEPPAALPAEAPPAEAPSSLIETALDLDLEPQEAPPQEAPAPVISLPEPPVAGFAMPPEGAPPPVEQEGVPAAVGSYDPTGVQQQPEQRPADELYVLVDRDEKQEAPRRSAWGLVAGLLVAACILVLLAAAFLSQDRTKKPAPPVAMTNPPKPEPAKPEPAKPEPVKPEPPKPEPPKPEPPKPEPVKPEPPKPEPPKPEPVKPEPPKPEPPKPEPPKPEPAKPEPPKPEPPKPEPPKPDPQEKLKQHLAKCAERLKSATPLYREIADAIDPMPEDRAMLQGLLTKAELVEKRLYDAQLGYVLVKAEAPDPSVIERRIGEIDGLLATIRACIKEFKARLG